MNGKSDWRDASIAEVNISKMNSFGYDFLDVEAFCGTRRYTARPLRYVCHIIDSQNTVRRPLDIIHDCSIEQQVERLLNLCLECGPQQGNRLLPESNQTYSTDSA
jgi:hypothetical protein